MKMAELMETVLAIAPEAVGVVNADGSVQILLNVELNENDEIVPIGQAND